MKDSKLLNFIEEVFDDSVFEGCKYYYLGDKLYLVFATTEDNDLKCKVAFNCDDLQCDFDYDWVSPAAYDEEYDYEEWYSLKSYDYTPKELEEEVLELYEALVIGGFTPDEYEDD